MLSTLAQYNNSDPVPVADPHLSPEARNNKTEAHEAIKWDSAARLNKPVAPKVPVKVAKVSN
jgi:hypothetical protein